MSYFTIIPKWKDNRRKNVIDGWGETTFVGDNSIVYQKFGTIEDALIAARQDGTCLREYLWDINEHRGLFGLIKIKISLESLRQKGYLSREVDKDEYSTIYKFI